jgi:phosphatidylinositol N-acetylglucosaminyltransferase subunit H
VVILDHHGIQFETHRGIPPIPLTASRHFIPATMLQDFIISEGLRRWDVRYYLAAVSRSATTGYTLEVAYEVRSHLLSISSFEFVNNMLL